MRRTLIVRMFAVRAFFGLVVAMAGPAAAARPEKNIVHDSFDDVLCGTIPVHVTVDGWTIFHIQTVVIEDSGPGTDGFWIGVIQDHYTVTFTNAAGVTVTQQAFQ